MQVGLKQAGQKASRLGHAGWSRQAGADLKHAGAGGLEQAGLAGGLEQAGRPGQAG